MTPRTVWVLTSEVNDYNQCGRYFEMVFGEKPTKEQLKEHLRWNDASLEHLLKGGGREAYENVWYYLEEEELK